MSRKPEGRGVRFSMASCVSVFVASLDQAAGSWAMQRIGWASASASMRSAAHAAGN
jgi:hypothetical protein